MLIGQGKTEISQGKVREFLNHGFDMVMYVIKRSISSNIFNSLRTDPLTYRTWL